MADNALTSTIVTVVLALGGGGTIGVVVKNMFDRKKVGADAAAVIL